MAAYVQPNEPIPFDGKHRWLAFADKPGRSTYRIKESLRSLGLYAWDVQQTGKKIGSDKVAYTALIEVDFVGVTPVKIALRLGVSNLLVRLEPVPWGIEVWVDAQEAFEGDPVPFDLLEGGERLNPGAYYGLMASWFGNAPAMDTVAARLKSKGYGVFVDAHLKGSTSGQSKFFYIKPKEGTNPSYEELKNVIGADTLHVNKHPLEGIEFLKEWTAGKMAMEKGLKEFSKSVADASTAIVDLGSSTAKATGLLAKTGQVLVYLLPVALLAGFGYYGYTKYREF